MPVYRRFAIGAPRYRNLRFLTRLSGIPVLNWYTGMGQYRFQSLPPTYLIAELMHFGLDGLPHERNAEGHGNGLPMEWREVL